MRDELLFYGRGDMFSVVQSRHTQIKPSIEKIPKEKLLNASEEDLVAALTEDLRLDVPVISEDHFVESHESKVDVSRDPRRLILDASQPFYVPGTMVVVSIPFTGDPAFFRIQPSTFSLNPPRGAVVGNELQLKYNRTDPDAAEVKRQYESDLQQIRSSLQSLSSSAQQFQQELPGLIRNEIQARKKRLLAADDMVATLGLKLKRRSDAPEINIVPMKRRTPRIQEISVPSQPFKPEYALEMDDYEEILRIISSMVHVMERSPNAFVGMDEESLRTHFLVQLNGQWEGQATGETFNATGKTDILIRAGDRNVFIAECKVWKGPKEFLKAIDQLLSYLSWRDTKAALIVFNRNARFSEVLASIRETTPSHSQYKRTIGYQQESGSRYVFRQPSDSNREIMLTVLAFDVPTQQRTPTSTASS
jgi:hypothetical protein